MAKQIYVEKEASIHSTTRKLGKDISSEGKDKTISFSSIKKDLILFKEDGYIIKFENHRYQTDNLKDIDYLQKHKAKGLDFFVGTLPEYVTNKWKEDAKLLEVDEESFMPAE